MNILILNSAQGKYPVGNNPWIQATLSVIRSLSGQDVHILCSTDPSPWDTVTYLAGINGMNVKLIVKSADDKAGYDEYARLRDEFALDENRTTPLFLGTHDYRHPKKVWQSRDCFALRNADVIYPVSIRRGGRLEKLLSLGNFDAEIRNDFRIEWSQNRWKINYNFVFRELNPFPADKWLIHWTRASQGHWKGEKAWEFYRDLFAYPSAYVRSAEKTLFKILDEHKIRSASWLLPKGENAVSFSSLDMKNSLNLMRWRKRFVRYSFEPFGIGIKSDILISMGAREVIYRRDSSESSSGDRLFIHSPGIKNNWKKEQEWRLRGDLILKGIDTHDKLIIVPDAATAERVRASFGHDFIIHTLFKD